MHLSEWEPVQLELHLEHDLLLGHQLQLLHHSTRQAQVDLLLCLVFDDGLVDDALAWTTCRTTKDSSIIIFIIIIVVAVKISAESVALIFGR